MQFEVSIFSLRQLHEKYLAKNRNLHFVFSDFEKSFEQVPSDVVCWASRNLGIKEWLVKIVQSICRNA